MSYDNTPDGFKTAGFEELSALWLNDDKTALADPMPGNHTDYYFSAGEVNDIIKLVRGRAEFDALKRYLASESSITRLLALKNKIASQGAWHKDDARKYVLTGIDMALDALTHLAAIS